MGWIGFGAENLPHEDLYSRQQRYFAVYGALIAEVAFVSR